MGETCQIYVICKSRCYELDLLPLVRPEQGQALLVSEPAHKWGCLNYSELSHLVFVGAEKKRTACY